MASLTVTVPDAQVDRVKAAFAERVGKDAVDVTSEDIRLEIVSLVKRIVKTYEGDEAERTARAGVVDVDAT